MSETQERVGLDARALLQILARDWDGMGNMTRREREEWMHQHEGLNPRQWRADQERQDA